MDSIEKEVLFHRITVHDQRVCETCQALSNLPADTLKNWDASGLAPGEADTECYPNCRCALLPSTLEDLENLKGSLEKGVETLIDEVRGNIITDITDGGTILLKNFEKIVGITTVPYLTIAKMESLITRWKIKNDYKPLPKEFFDIAHVEKQISWLRLQELANI